MIDWAQVGWNEEELEGVAEIRLTPQVQAGRMIAVKIEWFDTQQQAIRRDTHIEVLRPVDLLGTTGE